MCFVFYYFFVVCPVRYSVHAQYVPVLCDDGVVLGGVTVRADHLGLF